MAQIKTFFAKGSSNIKATGPGGHTPDGTGPYGSGNGPGQGRSDGSGMDERSSMTKSDAFPYGSIEEATTDLSGIVGAKDAPRWAKWLWNMANAGELERATAVIFDIVSKFVSICKGPAVESSTWLMKSKNTIIKDCNKKFIEFIKPVPGDKNSITTYNENAIFAAVLEPDITDANGELYPPWEVEKTAHLFMKEYLQMDNNHDYIPGAGRVIESWVPKNAIKMQTFDGVIKEYKPFTWFIGFEPSPYEKELIAKGERDGLSIGGEWPKIIFRTPGVKSMDDDEKKFFEEILKKNQEKTSEMLKASAEANEKALTTVTEKLTTGLEPLSGIKSALEQISPKPEAIPPAAGGDVSGTPPVADPAPSTPPPAEPAPAQTPAPVPQVPAPEAGAGTTEQDAQGTPGQGVAEASAPDNETPDQKVARLKKDLEVAEKMVEIRHRALAGAGSPVDDPNAQKGVVTDLEKAWEVHVASGSKAKIQRK